MRGRVTTLDGAPIARVAVSASLFKVANPDTLRDGGPLPVPVPLATAVTAAAGSFLIDALTPGTYWWLRPTAPARATCWRSATRSS